MPFKPERPLRKSDANHVIGGVCGGIAEWLEWDPSVVRAICVVATTMTAVMPGVVTYVALWVTMPRAVTVPRMTPTPGGPTVAAG